MTVVTFIKWQSVTSTFIVMLDVPLIIRFEANQYLSFVKNVYPWALLELIFLLCLKIMIVIGIVYIRHFFSKVYFQLTCSFIYNVFNKIFLISTKYRILSWQKVFIF